MYSEDLCHNERKEIYVLRDIKKRNNMYEKDVGKVHRESESMDLSSQHNMKRKKKEERERKRKKRKGPLEYVCLGKEEYKRKKSEVIIIINNIIYMKEEGRG
jgi:hypothetical protein